MLAVKKQTIFQEVKINIERVTNSYATNAENPHIINEKIKLEIANANELGNSLINATYEDDLTLLTLATKYGSIADVQYCLAQGANPTQSDIFGKQALHYLTNQADTIAKATLLLDTNKVDINQTDNLNNNTLHYVVNARGQRDYAYLEFLLEHGADPNCQGDKDKTPLHIAVQNGDLRAVRILLNHKKTLVNIPDNQGNTPLFYAQGRTELAPINDLLLAHQADVNHLNLAGKTPLTVSVERDDEAGTESLLKHGASPMRGGVNVPIYLLAVPFTHNKQILQRLNKHSYPAYWLGHGLAAGVLTFIYFAFLGATTILALQYAVAIGICTGLISKYYQDKKYQHYEFFKVHKSALHATNPESIAASKAGLASGESSLVAFLTWFNLNCYRHFGQYGFSQVAVITNDVEAQQWVKQLDTNCGVSQNH